jgi:hypothetical protein
MIFRTEPTQFAHFTHYVIYVVEKPFTPNDNDSKRFSRLFQILVWLDTISDWPWRVSWQYFYAQSLPTSNTDNTACLPCRHATPYKYHFTILCYVDLQKNRCMKKQLESSDLCLWLKSDAITSNPTCLMLNGCKTYSFHI